MKVVIAGSRGITDYALVPKAVEASGFKITEEVCGKAVGVDWLGEHYAKLNNIPVKEFPPEWNKYPPKVAPIMRNITMAEYADAAIIIWDGKSPGTRHMITEVSKRRKPCHVWIVEK